MHEKIGNFVLVFEILEVIGHFQRNLLHVLP